MSDQSAHPVRLVKSQKEEEEIDEIINQLQGSQNINTFFVLSKFLDCHEIKNEPQFFSILFNDHLQVILQLIQWMLLPKQVIRKKKINVNKTNIDSYPYQCKQLLKDNWCFYEQLYSAAKNKKMQFSLWFNFLRKEYFDQQTIFTALGYFTDVMIPFAKYQFPGTMNLTQSLEVTAAKKGEQNSTVIKLLPEFLIDELVKYCHYEPIFTFLKTAIFVSIEDERDYQLSRSAFLKMLKGVQINSIFSKFPIANEQSSQQVAKTMDYLQNIVNCVKQISQNIETNNEVLFRIIAMISVIIESNIIKYVVNQLTLSKICRVTIKQRDKSHTSIANSIHQTSSFDSSSQQSSNVQIGSTQNINISIYNLSPLPELGAYGPLVDADEEQLVEVMFKILSTMVQIFVKTPRTLNGVQDENKQNSQGQTKLQQSSTLSQKQKIKQFTYEQYQGITIQFREQMQYLLDNMQILTKFVYIDVDANIKNGVSKIIPFASGENVKAISFMKYQYFKLCKDQDGHDWGNDSPTKEGQDQVNKTGFNPKSPQKQMRQLVLGRKISKQMKDSPPLKKQFSKQSTKEDVKSDKKSLRRIKSIASQPFEFKIQKLQIIQIIKKYLNDNRWNNIAHHLLQKITHSLIMCSYDYIKKSIERDKNKKFSQSFLAFLIQSFTKRDFVFLNTVKFTTQGNLHSLYNIAKDLAYTLNSTNQLVIFLNEFQPWKKFIMNDLKNYQEKIYPKATKPQEQNKDEDDTYANLKVDEADSIKKLIENISEAKKWPKWTKCRTKSLSKGNIRDFRGSGELFAMLQMEDKQKSERMVTNSKQKSKTKDNNDLKEILKKKIENSRKNNQVRQFDIEDIYVRDKITENNKENDKNVVQKNAKL